MVSMNEIQYIPEGNMILLIGSPGAGKTTFCEQAALQNLVEDRPVIYVITEFGSSRAEIALKERGLGEIEPGLLSFIDAYNETVGVSVSDRLDTLYANCNNISSIDIAISRLSENIGKKGILLIFDSLTSPYLFNGTEILRFMRLTLSKFAAMGNAVMVSIDQGCGKPEDLVAMMSISNGVIKMEIKEGKWFLNIIKHPKVKPIKIKDIPIKLERRAQLHKLALDTDMINPGGAKLFMKSLLGGEKAVIRKEVGDFVNLFWTNLIHWSGMLWDPQRFPKMKYNLNKEDESMGYLMFKYFPWYVKFLMLFMKLKTPKKFSTVKDVKKGIQYYFSSLMKERSCIPEYLPDISNTDEHYIRAYENSDCCGFKKIGAPMALYLPSAIAGSVKGIETWRGFTREWNAIETKCIGLGDPYCEIKVVPGEIDELDNSLEKDSIVVEKVNEELMNRLIGFLLDGKPLVQRPRLGNKVHLHVVGHAIGWLSYVLGGERYQMAMRMGGAKVGKELGERLLNAGIEDNKAIKLLFHFLEHCKVGKVISGKAIRIMDNCESLYTKFWGGRHEYPSCYFTTGFFNGFFSTIKNKYVKETKCMARGEPYCEWEFR